MKVPSTLFFLLQALQWLQMARAASGVLRQRFARHAGSSLRTWLSCSAHDRVWALLRSNVGGVR